MVVPPHPMDESLACEPRLSHDPVWSAAEPEQATALACRPSAPVIAADALPPRRLSSELPYFPRPQLP